MSEAAESPFLVAALPELVDTILSFLSSKKDRSSLGQVARMFHARHRETTRSIQPRPRVDSALSLDDGLAAVTSCRWLERLTIWGPGVVGVTQGQLEGLAAGLPALKHLSLNLAAPPVDAPFDFSSLKQLRALDHLDLMPMTDFPTAWRHRNSHKVAVKITSLPARIHELFLSNMTPVDDNRLETLGQVLPNVTSLWLRRVALSSINSRFPAAWQRCLPFLNVDGDEWLSDDCYETLNNYSRLTHFSAEKPSLEFMLNANLPQLPALTSLTIMNAILGAGALHTLGQALGNRLQRLNLVQTSVDWVIDQPAFRLFKKITKLAVTFPKHPLDGVLDVNVFRLISKTLRSLVITRMESLTADVYDTLLSCIHRDTQLRLYEVSPAADPALYARVCANGHVGDPVKANPLAF